MNKSSRIVRLWASGIGMGLFSMAVVYITHQKAALQAQYSAGSVNLALRLIAVVGLFFSWAFAHEAFRDIRERKRRQQK